MLEEKITQVIDKLRTLKEENTSLNAKLSEQQEVLNKKDDELKTLRDELGSIDILKKDIETLNSERDTVRTQVENLIKELESVEL